MIYGIDPGFSGAIALYDPATSFLEIHDMPIAPGKNGKNQILHSAVLDILSEPGKALIEQVAARPGQGVTSMFRFGQGYGALEMACAASKLPLDYVTPRQWKAHFSLNGQKDVARGEASRQFPEHAHLFKRKRDDGRAEAALIALYGARQ